MRRDRAAPDRRAGFTLLEVVVAVAILGLAIAGTYRIFSTGFLQSSVAEAQTVALVHAEAKLAELDAGVLPVEDDQSGEIDELYRWHLRIVTIEDQPEIVAGTLVPISVEIMVSWGPEDRPRSLSLVTVRLAVPP